MKSILLSLSSIIIHIPAQLCLNLWRRPLLWNIFKVKSKAFTRFGHICQVCATVLPTIIVIIHLPALVAGFLGTPLLINKSKVKSKEFLRSGHNCQVYPTVLPTGIRDHWFNCLHNWLVVFACPLLMNMAKWNQGHGEQLDSIVRSILLSFILASCG